MGMSNKDVTTCQTFLAALKDAADKGKPLNAADIGRTVFGDNAEMAAKNLTRIFALCLKKRWVSGSGVGNDIHLTPTGRSQAST